MQIVRSLLALVLAGALGACSFTEPGGGEPRDVLSSALSDILTDVPAFGGVTYDDDSRLVVYTLGEAPEAEAEIRARLGPLLIEQDGDAIDAGYDLRQRPAHGHATVALRDRISAPLADTVELDPATGYVRVGVWTEYAARSVVHDLQEAGVSHTDVIVQVQDRP